jgi:hypothetical protein
LDDADIRWGVDHGRSVEETADSLCRTQAEIRQRIAEIAEADEIGDPSLLRDRRVASERVSVETYRDALGGNGIDPFEEIIAAIRRAAIEI